MRAVRGGAWGAGRRPGRGARLPRRRASFQRVTALGIAIEPPLPAQRVEREHDLAPVAAAGRGHQRDEILRPVLEGCLHRGEAPAPRSPPNPCLPLPRQPNTAAIAFRASPGTRLSSATRTLNAPPLAGEAKIPRRPRTAVSSARHTVASARGR